MHKDINQSHERNYLQYQEAKYGLTKLNLSEGTAQKDQLFDPNHKLTPGDIAK